MSIFPFSSNDPRPIGVFDSGVGGLTVLKSLMAALPGENFIYLGDTARVPYGTKSAETVRTYSTGLAKALLSHNAKMIVIACNTASVHAAQAVAAMSPAVPVISMIPPAAADAARATRNGHIMVMATQSTIRSGGYEQALKDLDPSIVVTGIPAQILIALAEEGWTDGEEARTVIERYIGPAFGRAGAPDTIILGCTHFPLLRGLIAQVAGPDVTLIDSGHAAARSILKSGYPVTENAIEAGSVRFMVTDAPERFQPLAMQFLGRPVRVEDVLHIDLSDFDRVPAAQHSVAI